MLTQFFRRYHYQTQMVLLIAAIFGAYGLKAITDWPALVYPLIAIVGIVVAAAREINQALSEHDVLADLKSKNSKV